MIKGRLILAALLFVVQWPSIFAQAAPQPIDARVVCYSLLLRAATFRQFGLTYVNEVASHDLPEPSDGELEFAPLDVPTTHYGAFYYTDGQLVERFIMEFILDIPQDDSDGNGVEDVLEFAPSVAGRTFGQYVNPEGEIGDFQADWTKGENAAFGVCRITFDFGPVFSHTFELFDYRGTFSPAAGQRRGPVTLTREGNPDQKLSGELAFDFVAPGRLKLTTTGLKTETNLDFQWAVPPEMERDGKEFWQFLEVIDGLPSDTAANNYNDWLISVIDPNDSDGDGIPDLGDTISVATAPRFEIVKTANGVRLLIHGDVGRAYTLEDAPALPAAQWFHQTTVTLSADPHIVDLPAPTEAIFWRMRFP